MTYIEYRMALAALTAEHRANVADLNKRYADFDRTDAKAERARVAREARSAQAFDKKARKLLDDFASEAWLAAWRGNSLTMEGVNMAVLGRAIALSDGRYRLGAQSSAGRTEIMRTR